MGYGFHPQNPPAQFLLQREAVRVGECRLARLANRAGLLDRVVGRWVLDQRVEDREEIRQAAAVRLAVALAQRGALRDLNREQRALRLRIADRAQPALDQRLLIGIAQAAR